MQDRPLLINVQRTRIVERSGRRRRLLACSIQWNVVHVELLFEIDGLIVY